MEEHVYISRGRLNSELLKWCGVLPKSLKHYKKKSLKQLPRIKTSALVWVQDRVIHARRTGLADPSRQDGELAM